MKFEKQVADFIEKRIQGKSFDEIAKELKVAKTTLMDWNKKAEVRKTINEGKAFSINTVLKAFQYDRLARLKTMLEISKKINEELSKRDLSTIETFKLFQIGIANENRISKIVENSVQIGEGAVIDMSDEGDGFFKFSLDE